MKITTYSEFWKFYLTEHSHPLNRRLHFIGTSLGLVQLLMAYFVGNAWFVLSGFITGYAFAWIGHFYIEKNRPATFKYPFWSFISDWRLWFEMLTGRSKQTT